MTYLRITQKPAQSAPKCQRNIVAVVKIVTEILV